MSFDSTQSIHSLSVRETSGVGVAQNIKEQELPAEKIKQKIRQSALSIIDNLGKGLQRTNPSLSDHSCIAESHIPVPSDASHSLTYVSVSSEKIRALGQKKEGVEKKEENEEIIGEELESHLMAWKALDDRCEKLKGQLSEIKLERNAFLAKRENIEKLIDQIGKSRANLEVKLRTYKHSFFSIFYKNTIENIKKNIQLIDQSQQKFAEKIQLINTSISEFQPHINLIEKNQASELISARNSYQILLGGLEHHLEQKMNQSHGQIDSLNPILTSIEDNASNLLQHLKKILGYVQSDEAFSSNSQNQLLEMRGESEEIVGTLHVHANELEQGLLKEEKKIEKSNQNERIKEIREGVIGEIGRRIKHSLLNLTTMVSQRCCFNSTVKEALLAEEHDLNTPLGSEKELLENSHVQLKGGPQERTSHPILSERYEINGRFYGEEVISRESVLEKNKQFSEKMIELLQSKLENPSLKLSKNDKAQIQKDITYYQNAIRNADHISDKDWIHSNYFRDLIRDSGNFTQAIGKYLSAPVNMRFQELKNERGERVSGFYRIGVISDMRNGWVSLKELKEIEELKRNSGDSPEKLKEAEDRISAIQTRITQISQKHEKKKGKMNSNQQKAMTYAQDQIHIFKTNPAQIIHERRRILQHQMIQLVIAQVGQNPEKIQEALQTGQFNMTHISLLDQEKRKLDKTGWMHDERIEMEDMAEIFAELRGKKLIFDGKGPSIDDASNIHMPSMNLPEGMEVTLNSHFFNISVHGTGHNDEFQYAQNLKEMMAMAEAGLISLEDESVQKLLNSGKLSYREAEDFFINILEPNKIAVSIGCLSAKDRTGVVGARAMQRFLNRLFGKNKNPFETSILSKNSLASQVISENTGTPLIKVDIYKAGEIKNISIFNKIDVVWRHACQFFSSKKLAD